MIFVTDAAGATTFASAHWSDYTGQPIEEALGLGWIACLHPEDREVTKAFLIDAVGQQVEFSVRYRLRLVDGGYVWIVAGAVPSFGPPARTFLGYLGSLTQLCTEGAESLRAYGSIGRFLPPPPHPATLPSSALELVADHLLIAHSLIEADGGKSALPDVRQALFKVGVELARAHRQAERFQ